MSTTADFTVDGFAAGIKEAMAAAGTGATERQGVARDFLQAAMQANEPAKMIATLQASVPDGANIAELMVHTSPELTMLFGRIPPHFMSGIHNHTIWACIGQLSGEEKNVFFERAEGSAGLKQVGSVTATVGTVITLPPDGIHHIENPQDDASCALHIYGGDFNAVMSQRSLWTWGDHEEISFTFPALMRESLKRMRAEGNTEGIQATTTAFSAAGNVLAALEAEDKQG
jgi:predicted metal-dependent enzyme (double-stranded beta helix superfamily)